MILSPACYRLPRLWQNAMLSLTCMGLTALFVAPLQAVGQNNIAPTIVGQQSLQTSAGSPLAISLADLQVVDPDNSYPEGFTLRLVRNSDAFQLSDNSVIPIETFEGLLEVTAVVNDGIADSDPFTLTVNVTGTTGAGGKDEENKGGGKKDEEKKGGDNKGGPKDDEKKGGGKEDDDKKGDDKKAGPKDKDDKKGDDKKEGPKDKDDKKGGDNKGGPKDKDDKKGGDNKGGPKDKDDKKDEEKKDDEKKGGDNKAGPKDQDDKKGGDKKEDEKNNGGNNGEGNNNGGNNNGNNGGGNNGGNNGGGNNGGGTNNSGNNGGGNNGQGSNGGGNNPPPPTNVAPVITGQHEITTAMNVAIDADLNMLKVDDPDNDYPDDFTLTLHTGNNYTLDGNSINPANNFTGTLEVRVQVNDGIANSNTFALKISVREGNIPPQVIGQAPLATDEETSLTIGFDDLIVFDPDSPYPDGFTINIADGEHHTADGNVVHPRENFSGPLTIMVKVNDGKLESDSYPLLITVNPVNDAPVLENMEREALAYVANAGQADITERLQVTDVDGDNIVGAEISFDMETYQSGHDLLTYESAGQDGPIEGVFDPDKGTLFLIGSATPSQYQKALRSVAYSFFHENTETVGATTKRLHLTVRDGKAESNVVSRTIAFSSEIALDVPKAFTPNGDMANDTWSVTPIQSAEEYTEAVTRIYTIRGQLLYEASGFEWQWDGRYEGEYLPSGTYYYVIAIQSGVRMSNRKGIVTILR